MPIQTADSMAASFVLDGVGAAVEDQQVDEQQHDDEGEEQRPHPGADVDRREALPLVVAASVLRGTRRGLPAQRVSPALPMTAWAAARRAIGTRNGEQDT